MSHFTVLVIGDNPEKQLKPFDENKKLPNSKWDWYKIGGRWAGKIILKDDVEKSKYPKPNFSWGWENKDIEEVLKENRVDIAYKKDIKNLNEIITFAVLKDGKWYEKGKMGWWGIVTNSKGEEKWEVEFKKLLENLNDNTLLSIWDCHI